VICADAIASEEQDHQKIRSTLSILTNFCVALVASFHEHFPSSITNSTLALLVLLNSSTAIL